MNTQPTTFRSHLRASGGISRANPELKRLAAATGFTLEHLFKIASDQRAASKRCALALIAAAGNPDLQLASFEVME